MLIAIIILAFVTFLSTLMGGLFALKFRKLLPYFFAFASGSMIAVTFFDILPEALDVSKAINLPFNYLMIATVGAFLFYHLMERFFLTHHYHEGAEGEEEEHGHIMGEVGAGTLIVHSLLDGVAIGTAFRVNEAMGLIVAFAVIFHDFTDGINIVTIMFKYKQNAKKAVVFLILGSLAPLAGFGLTFLLDIGQTALAIILAAFAGEFLYIATVTLLPEVHKHTTWKMNAIMIMGILTILGLTMLIR